MLASGRVPTPLIDTYAAAFGETALVATEQGLFEALADGPRDAAGVASEAGTDMRATEKVLNVLTSMRYLRYGRDGRYALTALARRFLLADAPSSVRDLVLMRRLELAWIDRLGEFLRSGDPLDVHGTMTDVDWGLYQRGMHAQAALSASEATRRTPVPKGARDMLDIGGSHGYFSVALCRRHQGLRSTVLDLPQAVEHAAPILAREGMGERVALRAGDALTDDLGTDAYDLVIMWSLVHHFDDPTNRSLVARIARALRPGGVLVIGEAIRPASPARAAQFSSFLDLYFALISEAGTWTFEEMAEWQRAAGLVPRRPIKMVIAQGIGMQAAARPVG
ncbi:MAG: class I SAM-dependent methyltransferase [Chloroflexi bacterium]|nr:class I SAM-dependent methyltransferase [Chloroflexota bacterium]